MSSGQDASNGAERSARELAEDLRLADHPEVFVVGDMIALNNLPGVAQVAIQSGAYAARAVARGVVASSQGRRAA